jgi:hypothetical protein
MVSMAYEEMITSKVEEVMMLYSEMQAMIKYLAEKAMTGWTQASVTIRY